jgi:hypothetical protein
MQNANMKISLSHQRGYTLLFAVLTATLVLGVTIFILSVSQKQFALSNIARESMYAVYAADSGIECIVADPYRSTAISGSFDCNDRIINKTFSVVSEYPAQIVPVLDVQMAKFSVGFKNTTNGPVDEVYGCAIVTIYAYDADDNGEVIENQAIIISRGYNLCTYNVSTSEYEPDTSSPRTVERAMQLEYH